MKESPENIRKGHYVVITRDRDYQEQTETPIGTLLRPPKEYDGIPYKVLANTLPFLVAKPIHPQVSANLICTLDVRRYDVIRVPHTYVTSFSSQENS